MKTLFLTEGGRDIGLGHIMRSMALSQGFKEKGIDSSFIVNGDSSVIDFLSKEQYWIFDWIKEKDRLFNEVRKNNIIVIDSYLADKELYEEISEIAGGQLLMIDDYNRIKYPKGVVVNPSISGESLDYPKASGVKSLVGKDYIILRREFWDVSPKKINKKVKNVLITFGGKDHSYLINEIIEYLNSRFNFNFTVVNPWENKLIALQMLGLMLKADICVSAGGQTLNELARVGVPTIGVCMADNQERNLEAWQEQGFLKFVGGYNDQHFMDNIELAIKEMISLPVRQKMLDVAKSCIDGQGVQRIAEHIIN